jgi:hypothetical protein
MVNTGGKNTVVSAGDKNVQVWAHTALRRTFGRSPETPILKDAQMSAIVRE